MIYDLTIVVPTFNERDNVRPLYDLLAQALAGTAWEVVFVDDDSPDGTAEAVRALAAEVGNLRLIHRVGRRGLSGACIEGILSSVSPFVAVIDGDLQHDETRLPVMLQQLRDDPQVDLVIGTRNALGGTAGEGLSPLRKWGSDLATSLAARLLRITASDPMSGFFMVRRESFVQIVTGLQSEGFKILADMLSASQGRWQVREVPFEFRSRQHGESKMDSAVTLEFLGLLLARMTGGLVSIRFVLFLMVGLSGVFVQLLTLRLLLSFVTESFLVAQTIGVFTAMTSNFVFNNALTYRDRALRGADFFRGLLSFYLVCSIGAAANIGLAETLYAFGAWPLFASICGAVVGALWNFVDSAVFTWRAK